MSNFGRPPEKDEGNTISWGLVGGSNERMPYGTNYGSRYRSDGKADFINEKTYSGEALATLFCKKCGCSEFMVGSSRYYTAIKCPECGWEECVHEG
jgi:predicted nucleic-acid-binding Zn-ribbon protein